ncbi:hypothetical protein [uncultured Georgenia sp.]|uniref:hypothetical protein n=1 Tax=uncultured Georgenia sp. TaxID=378209 RepID=UPI00262B5E2F|nr:hypothetical protein [uncultured Georgenia sp.]HLV04165.1 hypothetical protein [Actinomycetaceae bacterium]
MRIFDRRRRPPVPADVGAGFWVAEARGLQRAIGFALTAAERAATTAPATLQLSPGLEGRVVVQWRNHIVGFVPPAHAASLRAQLAAADGAELVVEGHVVHHDGLWRIWAGPDLPADPPPPDDDGEVEPPPTTIFGIALPGRRERRPGRRRTTAPARVLAVGSRSWEVRDGEDVDLALLRTRLAAASPGDTLHVRVWDEPVEVHLGPDARVTLTDPATGAVEVLYPRG